MTVDGFVDLVARMRDAQKVYFKTRCMFDLEAARCLEKEVDDVLAGYEKWLTENKQPLLLGSYKK